MSTRRAARILIAEDEIVTAMAIEDSLRNLGYELAGIVATGMEAIEKAAQVRPDLVLMDIRLKGEVDGIVATQRIQSALDIPVVYLTAHSDEETLKRVIHSNPYGCIIKPFREDELREVIEAALRRHRLERS